jgi:hypothetical protein
MSLEPREKVPRKMGRGFVVPWNRGRRPCMYSEGRAALVDLCTEWKRALPVPSGGGARVGRV